MFLRLPQIERGVAAAFLTALSIGVAALCANELDIKADKLIYLDRGRTAEFRDNVKFSREGFRGSSSYLRLDRDRRKIFASGSVYSVFTGTSSKRVELWTGKLNYSEKSDHLSSGEKSQFVVTVSTDGKTVSKYDIRCASFYGCPGSQNFHLYGKPVTIAGDEVSGSSDEAVLTRSVIDMKGSASLRYIKGKPYNGSAQTIKIDLTKNRVDFIKSVRAQFYAENSESK